MRHRFHWAICLAFVAVLLAGCGESTDEPADCPEGTVRCGAACVDTDSDASHCGGCGQACGGEEACVAGACAPECPAEQILCGDACVDPMTDAAHCGGCEQACDEGLSCTEGVCGDGCDSGEQRCGDTCVDVSSDPAHCGACGEDCEDGEVCSDGTCAADCPDGQVACAGGCVDTSSDDAHCGACGNACEGDQVCVDGDCACPSGLEACDGRCLDTDTDAENCGDCGRSCLGRDHASGGVCAAGQCELSCDDGFADCDGDPSNGCEAELAEDAGNCGQCGVDCSDGANVAEAVCVAGACHQVSCQPGFANCDSEDHSRCETDIDSVDHCGGCGLGCASLPNNVAEPACTEGVCDLTCAEGWHDCDEDVFNGCEAYTEADPNNCGGCDIRCGAGEICSNGTCFDPEVVQWPPLPPSLADHVYEVDGGVVRDPATKLEWQKGAESPKTYDEAALACSSLKLGGHDDWRVPTLAELQSIVDYGAFNPAIRSDIFEGPFADYFSYSWTSTPVHGKENSVWYLRNAVGMIGDELTTSDRTHSVRCVRGGEGSNEVRFAVDGDTVTDKRTGLMWQKGVSAQPQAFDQVDASCKAGSWGGHTDWRAPTIRELESLRDVRRAAPAIDTSIFSGTPAGLQWSGTQEIYYEDAWAVDWSDGSVYPEYWEPGADPKTPVRCVRSVASE